MLLILNFERRRGRERNARTKWQFCILPLFCDFAESGHEVIEGKGEVTFCSWLYFTWPTDNEGNANATLVCTTLQATELTVVIEIFGICSTLFMRAVITGKNQHGIISQTLFLQHLDNLTYLRIQAGYHSSKLGMSLGRGVIA